MIHITLPDGSVREYNAGVSAADVARSISEGLARKVLAAEVNGEIWDSSRPINNDASLRLLTWDDKGAKSTFWHSSAHLMAEALEALFPGVKLGIGPAIEAGFYYDVDLGDRSITEDDLRKLEAKMKELAKHNSVYERKDVSKEDAIAYFTDKADPYKLELLEEAKKRDHRKLGKELELFTFSEKVGSGLPLWLPKGAMLRERLQQFLQKAQLETGYLPVITPHIGSKQLYVTSGHWEKYGKDSFRPITTPQEGEEFMLKPMNCPHHCEIYKSSPRSYKDLPLRLAEFGTVYRYEQSGELHGLTRVRGFTQDDAHLFCTPEQVSNEFMKVIDLVLYVFESLGFTEYTAQVSLRDKEDRSKYIGTEENWAIAENSIIDAAAAKGLNTVIEYGEAAFYGPKLDFMVRDALGRRWQLGTIQVDYNLPERFELEYVDSDNTRKRPVMIHRAPFGSMERFIAVLLEHCGGNLPLWLAPLQVKVLPISDKYNDYALKVIETLKQSDVRAEIDDRSEKIGRKIRDTELMKVPYMLIVGEKEAAEGMVAVRKHSEGDKGAVTIAEFAAEIQQIVKEQMKGKRQNTVQA